MKRNRKPLAFEMSEGPALFRRPDQRRDAEFIAFIVQLVASSTGIDAVEITSDTRHCAGAALARQIVIYLAHTIWGWSLARAAASFGRDRTTASHACRRVEDLRDDAGFDARLQRLENCVRAAPFSGVCS
jgi:chromosomal replication initiation ATPase DnaA